MELTDIESSVLPFFAKSLLDEQNGVMQCILEYKPELDELIDIEGLEACEWSYEDKEWRLEDGTTFDPISRLLLFPPVEFVKSLLNAESLTLYECLFLLGYARDKSGVCLDMMQAAIRAIIKLVILPRDPETHLRLGETPEKRLDGTLVCPDLTWLLTFEEAEKWATNSFSISLRALRDRLLKETPVRKVMPTDIKPAYLNENNAMFSRELSIAIEAWMQVLFSNPSRPKKGSRKSLILEWLDKNHKELTAQAKERIATMINPDSNGGTPKTPEL